MCVCICKYAHKCYYFILFFFFFGLFLHISWYKIRILHAKSLQSCLTLCDSMNCNPPGFSVCGIFQARILERVVISSSGNLSDPRIEPGSPEFPASKGRFFYLQCHLESPQDKDNKRKCVGLSEDIQKPVNCYIIQKKCSVYSIIF